MSIQQQNQKSVAAFPFFFSFPQNLIAEPDQSPSKLNDRDSFNGKTAGFRRKLFYIFVANDGDREINLASEDH